jgi:hypothetical protein
MACPHVAGAAAVLMSDEIDDASIVRTLLRTTAVDLGAQGNDPQYGSGRIDVLVARGGVPSSGGDDSGSQPADGIAHIQSIRYESASRGRDLVIKVTVVDAAMGDAPLSGASVTVSLIEEVAGTDYGLAQGTTNNAGVVSFRLRRARSGLYTTTVTNVSKASYQWDEANATFTDSF